MPCYITLVGNTIGAHLCDNCCEFYHVHTTVQSAIFVPKWLQAKEIHNGSSTTPGFEAMKRVTGLTDLDQFRVDNLYNNDDPMGEIILTTKSPKELVGEI